MKLNDAGMALIERWESFRSKPYLCQAEKPTIGYGTTVYPNGKRVTLQDAPITKEMAMIYKRHDLSIFTKAVTRLLKVKLSENRFSALVCFTYNVGIGSNDPEKPGGLTRSTLLKVVNEAQGSPGIREEFMKYNKFTDKTTGKRKVSQGLINRRRAEADLYFSV